MEEREGTDRVRVGGQRKVYEKNLINIIQRTIIVI